MEIRGGASAGGYGNTEERKIRRELREEKDRGQAAAVNGNR